MRLPHRIAAGFAVALFAVSPALATSAAEAPQAPQPAQLQQAVRGLYERGVRHLEAGELEEAKQCFLQVTQASPNFASAYNSLGIVHFQLGYLDLAVENIEKAAALGYKNARSLYLVGLCYSRLGRHEDALEAYLESTRLEPQFMSGHHNAGLTYFQLEKWVEARDSLKRALELDPKNDRVMFVLGLAYIKNKQPEQALDIITALRGMHLENKAAKLESFMRPAPDTSAPEEPPPPLFEPDLPMNEPVPYAQPPRGPGTLTITGEARINIQGAQPEDSGEEAVEEEGY